MHLDLRLRNIKLVRNRSIKMGSNNKTIVVGVLVILCLVTMGSFVGVVNAKFDCMQVCHDACQEAKNAGRYKANPALFDTCNNVCPA